jgi:hypothetical protein
MVDQHYYHQHKPKSSMSSMFHVARRELERKFEIFLLAGHARMERESSAKEI